ncbi:protein ANTAGONIST OF LIKE HETEROCHROMATIN PROTEIN 1-like [Benincasa hispida]|uniref:protein ANTAGONIST OF LIKE HETEROCHROMATIN PROTEIN 1-like n=1 Tax=Benincasa hispida TaxID=102211 RepID=UPI0019002EF9|nr:protein ANTAGONIST OF LIKE HETEROCHROMATIN PROTEIN 1-like [Benincasa hispida]
MDSPQLAALLSSLISQLLLLLFLLFPSSNPHSLFSNSTPDSNFYANLFTHFLFSQDFAASLPFLSVSRKRKRTNPSDHLELGSSHGRFDHLFRTRTPDSFRNHFRMTSSTFEWLSGLLEPLLECRDPVGSPLDLSVEIRLGVGLYRLATGCDFSKISHQFGVSESVARFCAKQLCRVLCTNFRFWVEFPCPNELELTSSAFEDLAGLPNCCGVVTCTSIVAGFRGDKDDSTVLMSSTLFKDIEQGRLLDAPPVYLHGVAVNQYLFGHGEYPLLPWLMLPFAGAVSGSTEESFNKAHRLMCIPALKAIVSLRNWGVLSKPMHEEFKTAVAYIGACSILHNALLMREDFSAMADEWESLASFDHRSQYVEDKLNEDSTNEKASIIQRALAVRARELHS